MTRVNRILCFCSREELDRRIENPVNTVRENIGLTQSVISNIDELKAVLTPLFLKMQVCILSEVYNEPYWLSEAQMSDVLDNTLKNAGGISVAFRIACCGLPYPENNCRVGVHALLDVLFSHIKSEMTQLWFSWVIDNEVSPFLYPEQVSAVREWQSRYGVHIARNQKSPFQIAHNYKFFFQKLAEQHNDLCKLIRK